MPRTPFGRQRRRLIPALWFPTFRRCRIWWTIQWQRRFQLYILVAFAGMALLLACSGIYGVLSFAVGRRTGEIGIRMAHGARPEQIRRAMLRQGMAPVIVGLIAGVAASAASGRLVQSLLFGIEALDPATYVLASGVLICVGLLACLPRHGGRPG